MKNTLWLLGLVNTIGLAGVTASANATPGKRPNIILIIADDLGYGELGCQGNSQIPTPNIDAIARKGIRFTEGYVSAPNCSPSRAGLLTGKYQTRFGYEGNPIGEKNADPAYGLPRNQKTMAEALHQIGYATAMIGKWHLGGTANYHPMRRGFDEFFGFLHEGHYYAYPPWNGVTSMYRRRTLPDGTKGRWIGDKVVYYTALGYDEPPYDADNPIIRGSQPVEESAYLTEAFTREAIGFIERHKDQPFFLQLSYNAVHSPMQAKDQDMEHFTWIEDIQRRIFAGMLVSMDKGIGEVCEKLRDLNIEENSIIIFLSDNGGPTLELTSSNAPLRGEKGSMYEGGIRVPFMIQWIGKIPAGKVYNYPVISLDIFPTLASATGAEIPEDIDGVDLMPYLTGTNNAQPHQYLFWRQNARTALRAGDWKIINSRPNKNAMEWELYNIADDISESNNLKERYPEKFRELFSIWNEFNSRMMEPLF